MRARPVTGRCRRWRSSATPSAAARPAAPSRSATTASVRRFSTTTIPQFQFVANATWIKGTHNVKFGADMHWQHMNHYEISPLSGLTFTGIATTLNGGAGRQFVQRAGRLPARLLRDQQHRQEPGLPGHRRWLRERASRVDARAADERVCARSVATRAEADPVARAAVGVLPGADACRSRRRVLRPGDQSRPPVRRRRQQRDLRRERREESVHASPRHRLSAVRLAGHCGPGIPGIRRTTTCTATRPTPTRHR